jgi:hypothetical protein
MPYYRSFLSLRFDIVAIAIRDYNSIAQLSPIHQERLETGSMGDVMETGMLESGPLRPKARGPVLTSVLPGLA